MKYYPSLLILFISIMICESCKKDLDVDDNNIISELISNLEETPEILHGSWNLTQNNSNIDPEGIKCEAKNIHFLDNNSFYLQFQSCLF